MTAPLFAILAALALYPAPALAGVCHCENLMPEFFAFEAATKDLAPDIRADRFAKDIAARHPEFYGDPEFGSPTDLHKAALRLLDPARAESFPGFPPLSEARFHAVADTIDRDFTAAQSKFLARFPDFACTAEVAFGPSFLHFDGNGYTDAHGQWRMLFGVDAIALLHGPQDMPSFFTHEIFHIYHRQLVGSRAPKPDNVTWWSMWFEGLATYMSQRLNPPLDAQQVLWVPQDLVQTMTAKGVTARAAKLMLADFDKAGVDHWFDSRQGPGGLPPRAGYYLGYLMARELGRDHSLGWLAHLPPDDVKRRARAFLEAQAKGAS
jgi:hypothetical protein